MLAGTPAHGLPVACGALPLCVMQTSVACSWGLAEEEVPEHAEAEMLVNCLSKEWFEMSDASVVMRNCRCNQAFCNNKICDGICDSNCS